MNSWVTTGLFVVVLGIVVGSVPVVFIGGAILAIRIVAERWPKRVLDGLQYERTVTPSRTVVGDPVELRLSLWNRTRLPIAWASAEDTLASALRVESASAIPAVAGPMRAYERVTRRLDVIPTRRGVHEIGPVRFGVAEHFASHYPHIDKPVEPATIVARPLMAPLAGGTRAVAPLAQVRASRSLYTDPTLFAGVRPFQSGDPLRSIHWRATAREGAPQAKRFEPALGRQQVLVLDVQTVEGPYWLLAYDERLFEDLCVAAVSLARELITRDASCGFAAAGFSGTIQRAIYLPPRADRAQIERIADVLARLTSESSMPLTNLLAWLPQRVPRGTMLVILSGRSPQTTAPIVRRLQRSGFPIQYVLFRDARDDVADARRAGLAAWSARVDAESGTPKAVQISG